jgi:peptidoglycan hydrolase-like protein with peptidoglycan-binding domain
MSRSRGGRTLILLVSVGVASALGWWAGREALVSPEDPLDEPEPISYTVVEGVVEHSLSFVAVAQWEAIPLARSESAGVVTSVEIAPGQQVADGDPLFSVDLRPVVVASGATPAFRDMGPLDEGDDVRQLQELLSILGFFDGDLDGVFGSGTTAAVRAWQESLGIAVDGVVRLGDLVFVEGLPTRVVLGEEVVVGARLAGGEQAIWDLPDDPSFWVPLAPEQRSLVPIEAPVMVSNGGGVWESVVVEALESEGPEGGVGELRFILRGSGGGPVCGSECPERVPLEGRSDFPAEIVVVPETSGPVVPVAAIQTAADGSTFVTLEPNETVGVELVASHAGLAVVEGVEIGDVLVLPFTAPPESTG